MGSDKGREEIQTLLSHRLRERNFFPLFVCIVCCGLRLLYARRYIRIIRRRKKNAYHSADYWDPSYTTYHCAALMCAVVTFSGTL